MAFKALLVGINAYQQASLRGCVNDVKQVRDLITQRYRATENETRVLLDGEATKARITDGLRWLAATDPGETAPLRLFHYSGHGVFEPDQNGDEDDGRDECLVPYDYTSAGMLSDDVLREMYDQFLPDTHLLIIADCCHSGGNQRDIANDIVHRFLQRSEEEEARVEQEIQAALRKNRAQKQQFVTQTMSEMLQRSPGTMSQDELARQVQDLMAQFDKKHYGVAEIPGNVVLLAACKPDQKADDARFGDAYNGALTYYLTETLAGAGGQMPYSALIEGIGKAMRDQHVQEPQLECAVDARDALFLRDAIS